MSCCRVIVHILSRFKYALRQGFTELCANGCILGSSYLVRPNYHKCERCLWLLIFIVSSSFAFILLSKYLHNYSENVYRVVYEDHGPNEKFQYPALGICELGFLENTHQVDEILESSVFAVYPDLKVDNKIFRQFLTQIAFQNLETEPQNDFRVFVNYTKTLPLQSRNILENINYKDLVDKIRSPCPEFFEYCEWQQKSVRCCAHFKEISTMLGKCFIFNSLQNYSTKCQNLVNNLQIYNEPYRFTVILNKPAQIFILNNKDIPESITPVARQTLTEENTELYLGITIIPMVNDPGLADLHQNVTNCIHSNEQAVIGNRTYLYQSYTTCITDCFFKQQLKVCNCTNLYHRKPKAAYCKLSQYACLEEHGFINLQTMLPLKYPFCRHCLINCEDSHIVVDSLYYRTNNSLQGKRLLELTLLNFPTKHRRRQIIRQPEDRLVSLSGILCLFLGANVVNIIEFLYLFVRALIKQPSANIRLTLQPYME